MYVLFFEVCDLYCWKHMPMRYSRIFFFMGWFHFYDYLLNERRLPICMK